MICAMNSTCRAEAEPAAAAERDAEAEAEERQVEFTAEISAANFRTDAPKLWVLCLRNVYPDPR